MWDKRYSETGYVFGTAPNDFLVSVVNRIPKGRVLCLADGEGRNGVFLAEQGYSVTAVDSSAVGIEKSQRLAAERGVTLSTIVADLADFVIEPGAWQGIVSVFCHLPPVLREQVYRESVAGLVAGGVFVMEVYSPRQLQFKTGGPSNVEMLMTVADVQRELQGLDFAVLHEIERDIHEGKGHTGRSGVVQVFGIKPPNGQ